MSTKINILAIILARGNSKGVKKKNIRKLNGKPLIYYTINEAKKSKIFKNIIVSTESNEVAKISKFYGAEVPFLRPKKFATDRAKAIDAIYFTFKEAEKLFNIKYDYIIEIMCTNPFKSYKDIRNVANIQIKTKADSVIAVTKLEDHHPIRIKKIIKGKIVNFCLNEITESRRQDLKPDAYIRCGSIYSMKRDMLEKKIRYGTKNSRAYIMPNDRVVNIDTKRDFEFAEYLMRKNEKKT
jgi:CMP-N-acetylneuraminic acid synthetase